MSMPPLHTALVQVLAPMRAEGRRGSRSHVLAAAARRASAVVGAPTEDRVGQLSLPRGQLVLSTFIVGQCVGSDGVAIELGDGVLQARSRAQSVEPSWPSATFGDAPLPAADHTRHRRRPPRPTWHPVPYHEKREGAEHPSVYRR